MDLNPKWFVQTLWQKPITDPQYLFFSLLGTQPAHFPRFSCWQVRPCNWSLSDEMWAQVVSHCLDWFIKPLHITAPLFSLFWLPGTLIVSMTRRATIFIGSPQSSAWVPKLHCHPKHSPGTINWKRNHLLIDYAVVGYVVVCCWNVDIY